MIEFTPLLNPNGPEPLYLQLYKHIKREIETGGIPPYSRLPSKRTLAASIQVSHNTVNAAYQQLVAEGYVEARARSGYYAGKAMDDSSIDQAPHMAQVVEEWRDERKEYEFVFDHAGVDHASFPYEALRKLYREALSGEDPSLLSLGDPQGDPGLRKELAGYLRRSRGVQCSPAQIVIGSGTQSLLVLLLQLLGWDRKFAVENPGYSKARQIMVHNDVQVVPISLDEEGLQVSELREHEAEIVYVTPSHQFPTGIVMPISRRYELLQWASEQEGRFIIEDDYDSEFRYAGKPIPSLQGLDAYGKVIYIGTVSKALMPSLRIAYMVLPVKLLELYRQRFMFYTQTVSRVEQNMMERFIREGLWASHIQKMRKIYRRKRDVLISSIRASFPDRFTIRGQHAGLHILLESTRNIPEKQLVESARNVKVLVHPLSIHYAEQTKPILCSSVLLGFANLSHHEIEAGVLRLQKAWG